MTAKSTLGVSIMKPIQLPQNCTIQLHQSDTCLRRSIFIGRADKELPRTMDALETAVCSQVKANMRCMIAFRPCLKTFSRSVYGIAISALRRTVKTICASDAKKQELINAFECLQSEAQLNSVFQIMHKITAEIDYVSKNTPIQRLLPNMCCGYHKTMHDVSVMLDGMCPTQVTKIYILNLVHSIFGDVLDVGCGKYSSDGECRKLIPDDMAIIDNIANEVEKNNTVFDHSPIVPLLTVMERLDSNE